MSKFKKLCLILCAALIFLCGCANLSGKPGEKRTADENDRVCVFFKKYFDGGKYLTEFKSWEESTGESMTCTMAVDGENYYFQYETADGKQTFFVKDGKNYGILDDMKSYVVEDADKNAQRQEDFNSKNVLGKTYTVCRETIGDNTYECEKFVSENGEESHYCFDKEGNLKYIITKMGDRKVYLEFLSINTDVPTSYFEIPEGYQKIEY